MGFGRASRALGCGIMCYFTNRFLCIFFTPAHLRQASFNCSSWFFNCVAAWKRICIENRLEGNIFWAYGCVYDEITFHQKKILSTVVPVQ